MRVAPPASASPISTASLVSLAALHGRPVLVTFIDPLCRNYCPIEAQRLNDVVNTLPAGSKPAIVAVSVNVYGNTRAILREDGQKWKLVPEWRWAIGHPAALSRVWSAYHVEVLATTKKLAGVTVHTIAHTEGAYLIDAKGYERALFLWPYQRGWRRQDATGAYFVARAAAARRARAPRSRRAR